MGSGYSVGVPKCPSNVDKTDYNAILKLYDILDTNGDFEVESDEVAQIANIHVQNKIKTCKNNINESVRKQTLVIEDTQRCLNNEISAIKSNCDIKIRKLTAQRMGDLTLSQTKSDIRVKDLRTEIQRYEVASAPVKQDMFINAVSVDNRISFPEFFKYMRKRTVNLKQMFPHLYN